MNEPGAVTAAAASSAACTAAVLSRWPVGSPPYAAGSKTNELFAVGNRDRAAASQEVGGGARCPRATLATLTMARSGVMGARVTSRRGVAEMFAAGGS